MLQHTSAADVPGRDSVMLCAKGRCSENTHFVGLFRCKAVVVSTSKWVRKRIHAETRNGRACVIFVGFS